MSSIDLLSVDDDEEPVAAGFSIDTMDKADWALRKIGRAERNIAQMEHLASALKAKIDARLAEIRKPYDRTVAAMTELLRPWADREMAELGIRSVKLISGKLAFRQNPAHLEVADEDAAIAWLQANNHSNAVRIKASVEKNVVKEIIKTSGEIPAGMELVAGDVRFVVEAERPLIEGGKA